MLYGEHSTEMCEERDRIFKTLKSSINRRHFHQLEDFCGTWHVARGTGLYVRRRDEWQTSQYSSFASNRKLPPFVYTIERGDVKDIHSCHKSCSLHTLERARDFMASEAGKRIWYCFALDCEKFVTWYLNLCAFREDYEDGDLLTSEQEKYVSDAGQCIRTCLFDSNMSISNSEIAQRYAPQSHFAQR